MTFIKKLYQNKNKIILLKNLSLFDSPQMYSGHCLLLDVSKEIRGFKLSGRTVTLHDYANYKYIKVFLDQKIHWIQVDKNGVSFVKARK